MSFSTFGQTQLLKDFDFTKGGYYILGTFSESDKNSLRDSMGEFYTDDIALLNKFKKDWVFNKPSGKHACGYHYKISICQEGLIIESFYINLNCKIIASNQSYFYFDPNLLRQFYGKLKKPFSQKNSFTSIQEARLFRTNILKDPTLIMTPSPDWIEYEGRFRFTYNCKEGAKDCLDENGKIFKSIETEIKKKYPNEKFKLEEVGGSSTSIELEITCNKSLSDKFNLYYRDKANYFGKWRPFDLTLKTYWTTKKG